MPKISNRANALMDEYAVMDLVSRFRNPADKKEVMRRAKEHDRTGNLREFLENPLEITTEEVIWRRREAYEALVGAGMSTDKAFEALRDRHEEIMKLLSIHQSGMGAIVEKTRAS